MIGAVLALCLTSAAPSPCAQAAPFKIPPEQPLDFRGPGREEPEPDVSEVVLGWLGPGDPDHPDFGELWRGALLALDQENAAGGYRGKPLRLVPSWSESPWSAAVVDVTRSVYERGAWAVIGGVDGATTHLAVQLALKSRFLLLSPGSTDVSTDRANVPWLFSLVPSDQRLAPVLAEGLDRERAGGAFAVAAATDHDSHAALVAMRREMARRRMTPATLVESALGASDILAVAARLAASEPNAVLVLAPSPAAGRLVAALRASGFSGPILGGAPLARSAFRRAAGAAADGVIVPLLTGPGRGQPAFVRAYEERWREAPDDAALHGYDAVRLVAEALRRSGLNRARLRDAVRALSPWAGASGSVAWDAVGRNDRPVSLAVWKGGRLASAAFAGPH